MQNPDKSPVAEVKRGDQVSFELGFDRDKLAQLDPATLVDRSSWEYEDRVERTKAVLDLYGRLPESIRFEPGTTAIFGENGSGKTLLADVIVMAVRMEQFRQEHGLSRDVNILDQKLDESGYVSADATPILYPSIPGILGGSNRNHEEEQKHAMFVARIADCVEVKDLVLHDPGEQVGAAMRTPAALGNVAMGMSSRQAIDFLASSGGRRRAPSIHIYDEPELGMSPRRHREELLPTLEGNVADGSVELVPSNSVILYDSSLPRIDLDVPERGIFIP